jgi:hypothetical protein
VTDPEQQLVFGTVVTTSTTVCNVLVDGATVSTLAIVPANLKGRLMGGTPSFGARVIGVRVGSRFYVTDVISGGAPTEWVFRAPGGYSTIFTHIGSFTCPAGWINGTWSVSGYVTAVQLGDFAMQIDGSYVQSDGGPHYFFNLTGVHETFPTYIWRQAITAGTHSIEVGSGTTISDGNDYLSLRLAWAPV